MEGEERRWIMNQFKFGSQRYQNALDDECLTPPDDAWLWNGCSWQDMN